LKLKNAAKLLGKQFACGSSVSETAAGAKEIVIQGDVMVDIPDVLVAQLQVCVRMAREPICYEAYHVKDVLAGTPRVHIFL
jgi:3-deoxy-D-manno-octulosonate 8-phosphate phosphatase KdsC-like HAD superfamily phosphatase